MMVDLEAMPVASLFANSLSIIREKAAARRIRLDLEVAEELGSIQVDVRKVKQIVYNLLSNAVKFAAEGGRVTLRTILVPRADVGQLSGSWPGRSLPLAESEFASFLKFSVTDNGIGVSREGLEHLFQPFSQIDSGLARRYEGTGLGLAMVKLLVELHGGTVAVESAVGEGSRFTVWLPQRTVAEGRHAWTKTPSGHRTVPTPGVRTALVVEDDYRSAELIRVQLEAEGLTVQVVTSAEDALAIVENQPLSLITLDIMLPGMDGWEFLANIRNRPACHNIPVVICSIVADRNKGFALGAAAVLQKPITRQALYETLAELGLVPLQPGQTLRVLVADDDPKAVELIAVRVLGLGGTVLRAYGGREAIEAARLHLPDLIVLDLLMPEVNGFDVVEALQGHRDTAVIPVLIVTAKQITSEDRAQLSGHVATILEKGNCDADRFVDEVRRAMAMRQLVT